MPAPVGAAIAQTPEASNSLLNIVDISAAYTVLQSDSGNVFMLSGGPYTITLPVAADLVEGWYCKFVVKENTPSGDIQITAGSAIIDMVMKDAGNGDISNSTAGTAKTLYCMHTECTKGDYINVFTDGTSYYMEALSAIDDAIDHTVQ